MAAIWLGLLLLIRAVSNVAEHYLHVVGKTGKVLLLLGNLLLELDELLMFALADGVVLGGALAALEG